MALLTGSFALAFGTGAVAACPENLPEPTRLVALYDGLSTPDPRDGALHQLAEAPLNHLGYRLDYLDAAAPLPDAPLSDEVAGVISWLDNPLPDPQAFAEWANALVTECGRPLRHIALGTPAVLHFGTDSPEVVAYLAGLGLIKAGPERAIAPSARTILSDPRMIGYETSYMPRGGALALLRATDRAEAHLSLLPTGQETETPVDLVVTSPTGGYASRAALVSHDQRLGDPLWILNPFVFFEAVLGSAPRPVGDTTTLYGRRLFFATIQSDGWLTTAPPGQLGDTGVQATTLLQRELIEPFPDIPVTVAVLAGDLDPAIAGAAAAQGRAAASAIFALPQVRPATNGYDLVRDWKRLHAEIETGAPAPDGLLNPSGGDEAVLSTTFRALGGLFDPLAGLDQTGPIRKYAAARFDPAREIGGAIDLTAQIAASDDAVPLFLWPSGALPGKDELDLLQSAGAVGFGGGRIPASPMVAHLSALNPISSPDRRQIYEAFPPDFTFTRSWSALPGALHGLSRAVAWTESPRRLAPFQLGYSANAAQRFDSRSAIRNALSQASGGAYHIIPASEYVEIAQGFHSLRIEPVAPLRWRILDRAALQSLRVDHAGGLVLDIDRSTGVLGATRTNGSLYIALDPAETAPVVNLATGDAPLGILPGATRPALIESGVPLRLISVDGCTTRLQLSGLPGQSLSFLLPPGQSLLADPDAPAALSVTDITDEGVIEVQLSDTVASDQDVTLGFSCAAP